MLFFIVSLKFRKQTTVLKVDSNTQPLLPSIKLIEDKILENSIHFRGPSSSSALFSSMVQKIDNKSNLKDKANNKQRYPFLWITVTFFRFLYLKKFYYFEDLLVWTSYQTLNLFTQTTY